MGSRGRKKDQKQSRCAIELQDINIESWGGSELQILTELRQNTSTEYFGDFGGSDTDTRDNPLWTWENDYTCGHLSIEG